jgi:cell division protein FtsI (penicillin-binding protein 3)
VTTRTLPPPLADSSRRLRVGTAIVMVLFLVIAVRLVEFQFVDGATLAAQGLNLRLQPVDLPASRGKIIDRDGAILAGSVEARYVFADPDLVKDPAATADALSPVLGVPRSELLPKLIPHRFDNGEAVRFEYLARGVPPPMGTSVSALGLPGVGVRRDESRVVPGHDLAANLIGFTGRDLTGLTGLEASYDDLLHGVDGKRTFEIGQGDKDVNLDQEIPGGYHEETAARPGSSLQLTIDRDLQFEVQRILGVKMASQKATVGAAIVLDVRTGEVLAQASYPFYDAANPLTSKPSDRGDAATDWVIEPGSVHKGIVFAACLQEGTAKPDDSVLVGPSIVKGDTRYVDSHVQNVPTAMTLPGILALSSNVGTITLADKLGAQKLYEYQRAFGLGEPTGEGLPGEAPGLVQPPANWSPTSYGSIPIGHGVSVTPLQMAAVYAAIANGGLYVQPHLIKAVIAPDGTATPGKAPTTRQVISAENAANLRTMLEAVVALKEGTGHSAAVDNYRVSGKTGTGRLIQDGKPVEGEVASFVGMAPADAPRYVIAVFAHTPGGNGGAVAGPAFSEMMGYTLRHFKVAPTGSKVPPFHIYA